jgi:ankyrin repeat protein
MQRDTLEKKNKDRAAHMAYCIDQKFVRHPLYERNLKKIIIECALLDTSQTLMSAVKNNDLSMVKVCFENDIDIYGRISGSYGLALATQLGYLKIVKYFIEQGFDIHHNDSSMNEAAVNGHLDVVNYLIEQDACLSICTPERAAKNNHTEVVKSLIRAQGYYGEYVMHWVVMKIAIQNNNLELVRFMNEEAVYGAGYRNEALRCAIDHGHTKLIKYLKPWPPYPHKFTRHNRVLY